MWLNGIDYPDGIIEALKDKNLVIFAGAGVSVGPPTSLPNFVNLANEIANGTGKSITDQDSCEVFLGHLKSENIDVNREAANILSHSAKQCNGMHNAIVDLFAKAEDIKIVTTNYDEMFEMSIKNKQLTINVYDSPAVPLGSDISGVIHIHGSVNNPKYMVLTDEDFGLAYLTEGYAARFLVKLFETYTILFVGYSYKDTILRYLTRAMSRKQGPKKYILTDDMESNWNALGINPIVFPKNKFEKVESSLVKLGIMSKRGLLGWKNLFKECANNPPMDLAIYTEIESCFSNFEKVRVLTECITGPEWIRLLDDKNVFSNIFEQNKELSDVDECWMQWLIKETIFNEDDELLKMIILHGRGINRILAQAIIRYMISNEEKVNASSLRKYLLLLEPYIDNAWDITALISIAKSLGLVENCFCLFKRYFDVTFIAEKNYYSNKCVAKHIFLGEYYNISESWEMCKFEFLSLYPQECMFFMREIMASLYERYKITNADGENTEPYEIYFLNIESKDDSRKENILLLMCEIFFETCMSVELQNVELFREVIADCIKHGSILLNKIGIKILRESNKITANDKFDIFMSASKDCHFAIKEQIFLLIAKIFDEISDERRDAFIDYIEKHTDGLDKTHEAYKIYTWCVWLKRNCKKIDKVNKLESAILDLYDFKPCEHPEWGFHFSSGTWIADQSPLTENEIIGMELQAFIDYLISYRDDSFEGPSRNGLLMLLSSCVIKNLEWTNNLINLLIEQEVKEDDVWFRILTGIENATYAIDDKIQLLKVITKNLHIVRNENSVSHMLLEFVGCKALRESFDLYEADLNFIADELWKHRDKDSFRANRLIDTCWNTITGRILHCKIRMVNFYDESIIPLQYKIFFEECLKNEEAYNDVMACVIVGYFSLFYKRDYAWTEIWLKRLLECADQNRFVAAWEGFIHCSNYIDIKLIDIYILIISKAVEHISLFNDDVRDGFIRFYATILIYSTDNPCSELIPKLYINIDNDSDIETFTLAIKHHLEHLEGEMIESLWDTWLEEHISNRFNNKPTKIRDKEKINLLSLLPELKPVFKQAIKMFSEENLPDNVDFFFSHRINENDIASEYPNEICNLITNLMNKKAFKFHYRDDIREIFARLGGIGLESKKAFLEAALKNGITINDDV